MANYNSGDLILIFICTDEVRLLIYCISQYKMVKYKHQEGGDMYVENYKYFCSC